MGCCSVEELLEDGLLLLSLRVLLVAVPVIVVAAIVLVPSVVVPLLFVAGPVVLRLRGSRRAVEGDLGVDEFLQLAPVQEDAAALRALIDGDTAAFVGPHRALAL